MKFATKIATLSLIFVFAIGIVFNYFVYTLSITTLKEQITNTMQDQVFHTIDKIDRMLFERYTDIKVIANDPVITSRSSDPKQITERLIEYRNRFKHYISLTFFDLKCIVIADTSGINIGKQLQFTECLPGITEGRDFDMLLGTSEMVKGNVFYFASPVKDKNGSVFGVVVSKMPVERLYNIVRQTTGPHEREENLNIDLVDKDGLLLYSTYNKKGILKDVLADWDALNRPLVAGNKMGIIIHSHPRKEEEYILVFAKEQGYLNFIGNEWTLLVDVPTKTAFAPAIELRNRMILIFLAAGILTALIIYFLSQKITGPITRLSNASVEIGKGNLNIKVDLTSNDEIGQLAGSFNKMAMDLKESHEKLLAHSRDLETKVTERTTDLKNANEQLQIELKERRIVVEQFWNLYDYNRKLFEVALVGIWIIDFLPLTEEDRESDPCYYWHKCVGVKIATNDVNKKMQEMVILQ